MKRFVLVLSLSAVAAVPSAAGEAWNVVEGPQGAIKGTWNMETHGAEVSGAARMAGAHGEVDYRVSGQLQKGVYLLRRVAASDHLDCIYQGSMKGDGSIVGSAVCGGRSGPWIAHPARR